METVQFKKQGDVNKAIRRKRYDSDETDIPSLSAIQKINASGLGAQEKRRLKALIGIKPSLQRFIEEDTLCDDETLMEYLSSNGLGVVFTDVKLDELCAVHATPVLVTDNKVPFKLPCTARDFTEPFKDDFVFSDNVGAEEFTSFLRYRMVSQTSKGQTQRLCKSVELILLSCVPNAHFYLDQRDPATRSVSLRPDVTVMRNGAMVVRIELKGLASELHIAEEELITKLRMDSVQSFPDHCKFCIGLAWAGNLLTAWKLTYSNDSFHKTLIHSFNLFELSQRVHFLKFLVNVSRWMLTVTQPCQHFHLPPSARVDTPNGHLVTYYGTFIAKHFRNFSKVQFERMKSVHQMRLNHVEHGEHHWENTETGTDFGADITTVGLRLKDALRNGLLTKEQAVAGVEAGMDELHGVGFAHNDLKLDNTFYHRSSQTVFLGDLEFLTPLTNKPLDVVRHPPENWTRQLANTGKTRGKQQGQLTAGDVDDWQLSRLRDEIRSAV